MVSLPLQYTDLLDLIRARDRIYTYIADRN